MIKNLRLINANIYGEMGNEIASLVGILSAGTITVKMRWDTTSGKTFSINGSNSRCSVSVLFIPD